MSAARHIEAFITKKIPKDYEDQVTQYFVVNDSLRSLFFVFYDPRFPAGLDFFFIQITRKERKDAIAQAIAEQRETLKWVREKVNELTKFVTLQTFPTPLEEIGAVREPIALPEATNEELSGLDRVHAGIKERSY